MLSRISPRQFDEWAMDYQDEPWDITLRQFSRAVAMIYNAILRGPASELKESDLLAWDFMVPKAEEAEEKPMVSSLQGIRSMIGV